MIRVQEGRAEEEEDENHGRSHGRIIFVGFPATMAVGRVLAHYGRGRWILRLEDIVESLAVLSQLRSIKKDCNRLKTRREICK